MSDADDILVRSRPVRAHGPVLACALLLLAVPAQGFEPTRADALFREGRALLTQGRYDEACAKLAQSDSLDPAVGTEFHLARCYELGGRSASALALYERIANATHAAGQDAREAAARARIEALAPHLSYLIVHAPSDVAGLELTLDGAPLGRDRWGTPQAVDAGAHAVVASAPGRMEWAGETRVDEAASVELAIPNLALVAPPLVSSPPPPAKASSATPLRLGAFVAGGVGLGLVGAGLVLGARSWQLHDEADGECQGRVCNERGLWLDRSAASEGNAASTLLAVGGALVATSVVVVWVTSRSDGARRAALQTSSIIGPRRVGLTIQTEF